MKIREKLDEVVVRALAAQQKFAEWSPNIHGTSRPQEPNSEKVVGEVLRIVREGIKEERERCARIVEEMDPGYDYEESVWAKWRTVDLIRNPKEEK